MSQNNFLSLCSPSNFAELGMIKGLLESSGIDFFVINEEYAALGPLMGFGDTTVTVMILAENLEESRNILMTQLGYKF